VEAGMMNKEQRNKPEKLSDFDRHLRPLDQQLVSLRQINDLVPPNLQIPQDWIDQALQSINLEPIDNEQSVDKLKTLFVSWGTDRDNIKKTFEYNRFLLNISQERPCLERNLGRLSLHISALEYEKGIHLVDINLVDYWPIWFSQSVYELRERAKLDNKKLAAIELLGAYALQNSELLVSCDGERFPYFNLAGLRHNEHDVLHVKLGKKDESVFILPVSEDVYGNDGYSTPTVDYKGRISGDDFGA
jgi:hypothetical protein